MSLLIKALNNLEKNKQAEKDKNKTAESVANESVSLDLTPVENKDLEFKSHQDEVPAMSEDVASSELKGGALGLELSLKKSAPEISSSMSIKQKAEDETSASLESNADALNQQAAAKIFAANKQAKAPLSKWALMGLGLVGALIVGLGVQIYYFTNKLATPEVRVINANTPIATGGVVSAQANQPQASVTQAPQQSPAVAAVDLTQSANTATVENKGVPQNEVVEKYKPTNLAENVVEAKVKSPINKAADKVANNNVPPVASQKSAEAALVESSDPTLTNRPAKSRGALAPRGNKKQEPVALTTKVKSQGIDPILLSAYQAFVRGEDASAQRQYRQVLQQDTLNIDALLGMAAIAQRQGREADAQGWYQKVLEIEPKNSIAQTAILTTQNSSSQGNEESRIKSMISQQPDDANLHAALGHLYARQNQWTFAQEAYFNASSLAPKNADYAFNLAISLDQMGKSGLALTQYQRALDLLNKSGGTSPDRAQLEARISKLQ